MTKAGDNPLGKSHERVGNYGILADQEGAGILGVFRCSGNEPRMLVLTLLLMLQDGVCNGLLQPNKHST